MRKEHHFLTQYPQAYALLVDLQGFADRVSKEKDLPAPDIFAFAAQVILSLREQPGTDEFNEAMTEQVVHDNNLTNLNRAFDYYLHDKLDQEALREGFQHTHVWR